MIKYRREVILSLIIISVFIALMSLDPIPQDLNYHNFADQRTILGVSNFFDVMSNFAFIVIGIMGTLLCMKLKTDLSWKIFFIGVALVSFGSGYYHLAPDNLRLVWDRLPMTIGFMALFIAILSEYVHKNSAKYLWLAVLIGFSSVIYWGIADDLRFYAWVQLAPIITIPFVMILYKSPYSHQRFLLFAFAFYIVAKFAEGYDLQIYNAIGLSGHSIKHLLAAMAPVSLYHMLKNRQLL